MNIAFDIDGILTLETNGYDYKNRTVNPEALDLIDKLRMTGNKIILFSSRDRIDLKTTERWLLMNNVYYDDIILNKPKYDVLVDDKAVNSIEDLKTFLKLK